MSDERRQERPRKSRASSSADEAGSSKSAPDADPSPLFVRDTARIWVLACASSNPLIVPEQPEANDLAEHLRRSPPVLLIPGREKDEKGSELDRNQLRSAAWTTVEPRLVDQAHEAAFDFAKRMMVAIGWLAVAAAGVRIHEVFETPSIVLGVLGVGFFGYTVVRYGYRIVRWHNRRVDAGHAVQQAEIKKNALATRLATALQLRAGLHSEQRGKSPDAELLDTNAYRNLIREKVTTVAELTALGDALNAALKFQDVRGEPRKIAEIAKDAGIDTESAIFFRDLAAAASEIKLTGQLESGF